MDKQGNTFHCYLACPGYVDLSLQGIKASCRDLLQLKLFLKAGHSTHPTPTLVLNPTVADRQTCLPGSGR